MASFICITALLTLALTNLIGGRARRPQHNRRKPDPSKLPLGATPRILTALFDTPDIILTFDRKIVLKGIPQYLTNTAKLPTTAVASAGATVVTLTYTTPGAVTSYTIPENDPAIHSFTGGAPASGTFLAPGA